MVSYHNLSPKVRYEFKYIEKLFVLQQLQQKLTEVMIPDPHACHGGYYVCSLYFDTADFKFYYEKLDGLNKRVKIRLRYYAPEKDKDIANAPFFLEAKHRNNNLIHKIRSKIDYKSVPQIIEGCLLSLPLEKKTQKTAILEHLILQQPLEPFCVVCYYRQPFISRIHPDLRITFDSHISTIGPSLFLQDPINKKFVLPSHLGILEIKFHWAMPLWLLEMCREAGLQLRRYSKYCSAMETLLPGLLKFN